MIRPQRPILLTTSKQRRGYVLLMTLALLVLSTTLLVAVGRSVAQHALQARLEQNQLQQRWGTISCRSAILQNAEQILVSREQEEKRAVPEYRTTIQLGDDSFTLIVADEQAKANVNGMIDQFGIQGAEDRVRQAITGSGLVNAVRLRTSLIDTSTPTTQPAGPPQLILGPGQIFDSISPDRLIAARSGVIPPMQTITCWGNAGLNVMRADQASMRLALTPMLTQIEISRLIGARDAVLKIPITSHLGNTADAPANTDAIGALLSQAHIDAAKRNKIALTSRSACHSLWIITADSRRQWYSLTVSDESNSTRPVASSIVW